MSNTDLLKDALVGLLFLMCGAAWTLVAVRAFRRQVWLPYASRREPPWCLADLLLLLLVLVCLQSGGSQLIEATTGLSLQGNLDELEPRARVASLLVAACSQLATVGVSLTIVKLRSGRALGELGFSGRHLGYDLRVGAFTFAMVAPIALLIQFVATNYQESVHPLVELMKTRSGFAFAASCAFSAVLAAPVGEEYAFRGLLQGLLERCWTWRMDVTSLLIGVVGENTNASEASLRGKAGHAVNPGQSPPLDGELQRETRDDGAFTPPVWPVFASSLAFALLHWNHGPDWIALFVFALGLGYATHRTGRLTAAITAHMLLNAWTVTMLLWPGDASR